MLHACFVQPFTLIVLVILLQLSPVEAWRRRKSVPPNSRAIPRDADDTEKAILTELYNATNGPEWTHQWGWLNSSIPVCNWEGVGCNISQDGTEVVTSLQLPSNSLEGNMTNLSGLQHLRLLDVSENKLEGRVENIGIDQMKVLSHIKLGFNHFVGTLGALSPSIVVLDFGNNELNGTLKSLHNLTLLQNLSLNDNMFTGKVPSVGSMGSLLHLDLSNNQNISGSLNESGIFNLTLLDSLNLANNNITGDIQGLRNVSSLTTLDLSQNRFSGNVSSTANLTLLNSLNLADNSFNGTLPDLSLLLSLQHLDLSSNGNMTGTLQGMEALTSLTSLNLAHNSFNGTVAIGALSSLQVLDLRQNNFTGGLDGVSVLTLLEWFDVSENSFNGSFPGVQAVTSLQYLNVSLNALTGTIPDVSKMTLLRWLDISNQYTSEVANGERTTRGITGTIPESISQLIFLQEIHMEYNLISGQIPQDISRLGFLSLLNLEHNELSGTIPASLNLLEQLEYLSLAHNRLFGPIPDLGGPEAVIRYVALKENTELEAPAPFQLCDLDDLDIKEEESYCPMDRQALVAFYQSTKGGDWDNAENWLEPDMHHCSWFGVECDDTNTTVLHLSLPRNGLAGAIPSALFNLTSLESIDFNDNVLRGPVPEELGMLSNLKKLRLSYNELTSIPSTFGQLSTLSFLHLHGNRISGDDSFVTVVAGENQVEYPFITDCGDPVDSLDPFVCEGCDMCCNSLEECQVPVVQTFDKFNGWVLALGIIAVIIAALGVSGCLINFLVQRNKLFPSKTNAHEACGEDSVYSFVLTKSYGGWIVTIGTLFIQVAIFALFLNASQFDNEISDWVYAWRCPRNTEECNTEATVGIYGWIMWALLVFTSVLDDFANGLKLLNLAASSKDYHSFCGSAIITSITVLAVWTSGTYNRAIAMTSTELIVNAVILLFVNDIDEQIFNAVKVIRPTWVDQLGEQADALSSRLIGADEKEAVSDRDVGETKFYNAQTWESTRNVVPPESSGESENEQE